MRNSHSQWAGQDDDADAEDDAVEETKPIISDAKAQTCPAHGFSVWIV